MRNIRLVRHALLLGTAIAVVTLGGCTGVRFVIDAVPAEDRMTETVVMKAGSEQWDRSSKVALIDVSGLLLDSRQPGLLADGESPVARFTEALTMAEADERVKAVILRINSPGGSVTASDVMYQEVLGFKERTGKPVVVQMETVAASGGYYLACAGDEIVAHPTTITGSIGVLIQTINFSDGLGRIGIHADAITSGPNKAMGSPLEPMPDEHRQLLQGIVDEFYDGFRAVVMERRPTLSPGDIDWVADGRVVTGRRAAEVGLVDRTGGLREAFEVARERAGLAGAKLVKYHRPLEHVASPYARTPIAEGNQVNLLQLNIDRGALIQQPGFYYLWDPSIF
ncbi:MAG: signal peptide peptidase SppA [Planctomycetota bacterium]|jgi:protease-4